jgi:hypothetical protein
MMAAIAHPPSGDAMPDNHGKKLESEGSQLKATLTKLEAVYKRFGRDGLKEYHLADVQLLLYSKQLAAEAANGRNLSDAQAEANRLLKLEVQDLTYYVRSQIAALQAPHSMSQLRTQAKTFEFKQKGKDRDYER